MSSVPLPCVPTCRFSPSLFISWYLATVIDRWLHYDRRPVVLAYILFLPVVEMFKILSSLILVMATYAVVWKDLQCRFPPRQQGVWWFAAKMLLFVTGLLSLYYWVLKFALAIVWMRFPALNVIADVATKMTQLEIAMKGFFFAFGLLTVAASSAVLVRMLWDSAKLVGVRRSPHSPGLHHASNKLTSPPPSRTTSSSGSPPCSSSPAPPPTSAPPSKPTPPLSRARPSS